MIKVLIAIMMKKLSLSVLLFCIVFSGYAQSGFEIHFPDFVECYYPNDLGPLVVYDGIAGNPIDSLENTSAYCWYKLAVQSSQNGWLKIENLMCIPACNEQSINEDIYKFKNMWVKCDNFLIDLPEFGTNLYTESKSESESMRISKFARGNVLEVAGKWAKVRLIMGEKNITEGWLRKERSICIAIYQLQLRNQANPCM